MTMTRMNCRQAVNAAVTDALDLAGYDFGCLAFGNTVEPDQALPIEIIRFLVFGDALSSAMTEEAETRERLNDQL